MTPLLVRPERAWALYVLAHGAGAGMRHAFMEAMSTALAEQGVATLRFEFPYMAKGSKRPDPPRVLEAAVRQAVEAAAQHGLPLFAGGKSMGGRITSQTQAAAALPGVRGLAFVGYPLHAAGKPETKRAAHLPRVSAPMLFLQGTRDKLADLTLLEPICAKLPHTTLHVIPDGDHSFHVPKRSGRTDAEVIAELAKTFAAWARPLAA